MYPNNSYDWLIRLINHNTISSLSNLALINEVADFVQSLGLMPTLTVNQSQDKANLFVSVYNANDPSLGKRGGIILSGHTDVVPVANQAWTHDPFDAYIKNGKLFGRGACDMKGFIACCLAFLPKAVELAACSQLKTTLHLALSFDEEIGCLGAPLMLADLAARGIWADYCIVGEPTLMQVVSAHKGISVYTCRVHGKSVHSSLTPQGVNAISYAARLIGYIDELGENLKDELNDTAFNVPYGTLSVGTIAGGTATNIIPNLCEFTFEYRNLPFANPKTTLAKIHAKAHELSQQMQKTDPKTGIDIIQDEDVPAMDDKDSGELQKLALALLGGDVSKVAYATEGGQFSQAGIPTIICGPGSIEQAHKADEYIALSELDKCDAFLRQLFVAD